MTEIIQLRIYLSTASSTPLELNSEMQQADILALANLRIDGRRGQELRQLKYKIGLTSGGAAGCSTSGADGSCYLEQGLNKVLALVLGPREPTTQGARPSGDKVCGWLADDWG